MKLPNNEVRSASHIGKGPRRLHQLASIMGFVSAGFAEFGPQLAI